jgi:hypothetical protein
VTKIIKFPGPKVDSEVRTLLAASNDLDDAIIQLMESGLTPPMAVGLLANRLGNLLRIMDDRDKLLDAVTDTLWSAALRVAEDEPVGN